MLACRPPNPTFNTVTTHESRPSLKSEYIRKIATDACLIGSMPTPHSSKIPPGLIKTRDCVPCTYTTNSGYNTLKSYPYSEYKLCECTLDLRRTRRRLACTSCSTHAKSLVPPCNNGHVNERTQRDAMAPGSGTSGQVNDRAFLPRQHDLTPSRFSPPSGGVCPPPAAAMRLQASVDPSVLQHRIKRPMRAPSSHCNRHYHLKGLCEADDGNQARHHALRMTSDSARHSYPTAYYSQHALEMAAAQRLSQGAVAEYSQPSDRKAVSTVQEPVRLRTQAHQHHHQRHHEHGHHSHIQPQQQQQSQDHSTKAERHPNHHLLSVDQRNSLPTVMDPRNFEAYASLLNDVHIR
ncbi:hypothetical protein SprV_0301290200 [Sparganum proliferum]